MYFKRVDVAYFEITYNFYIFNRVHIWQRIDVVGSIFADVTAFTDFVAFSEVLKPDRLFPTYGSAEALGLKWMDSAWNVFVLCKEP